MNWFKLAKKKEAVFKAILKRSPNGFHYLDIPQSFTNGLFDMLDDDKAEKHQYQQKQYNSVGSHVSVISEEELDDDMIIKEVGDYFEFNIGNAKCVKPEGWKGMKNVCFVEIESPQLEKLRTKYKLPKTYKNKGHKFHITFSIEKS